MLCTLCCALLFEMSFRKHARQAVFKLEEYQASIKNHKVYESAFNFWGACHTLAPQRGSPYNMMKIGWLRDKFFKQPRLDFPGTITVAVRSDENPLASFGSLMLISPPEICHAFLLSVAEHVTLNVADDDLMVWRTCMLTVSFKFLQIDGNDARYWRPLQVREDAGLFGDAVKRTAVQRGYDVMEVKAMLETARAHQLGADACVSAWKANVELAPNSELVKVSFMDACFAVWNRLMSDPTCSALVLSAELLQPSPFDSIYKLEAIVKKARTESCILFFLRGWACRHGEIKTHHST